MTSVETDTAPVAWTPVVYGRTRYVDSWWRAVPDGVVESGWLERAVQAATNGGATLEQGPRFLLARGPEHVLIGVACRARYLSEDMCTDNANIPRPLFCFVGWLRPHAGAPASDVPPLTMFEEQARQWAAPAYERWVRPDWLAPQRVAGQPRRSEPDGDPPWGTRAIPPEEPWARLVRPDAVRLIALTSRGRAWAQLATQTDEFTYVTGWTRTAHVPIGRLTHASAADAADQWVARPRPRTTTPTPVSAGNHPVPHGAGEDAREFANTPGATQSIWILLGFLWRLIVGRRSRPASQPPPEPDRHISFDQAMRTRREVKTDDKGPIGKFDEW